jgi:N-acetyl-gamma-glutamyl-phosphate reductase
MKVAVIGGAGYAGGELLRLLLQHPDVHEVIATSRSQAGKPVSDVHPQLTLLTDMRFSGATPAEAAAGKDVAFLALEHGESSRVMAAVVDAGAGLVVDLAADFRIHDGRLHERHYGAHPEPALVHRFEYGLADVRGEELRGARAIAAPGCFATAAQLALYSIAGLPLAAPPAVFAVTGSSGAGQSPRATTHHPSRANNMFAYAVMGHRHEGEVQEQWRAWRNDPDARARLMTHSGPWVRGIYATLHAHLEPTAPAGGRAPAPAGGLDVCGPGGGR